jgi:MSHA biogenesis protein MshP
VNRIQRGFSLVSAIFLLVVLAALGAAMVTFSTTQNQSMVMDVMGARAYQAANAGIEWAAYNIELSPGVSSPAAKVFSPTVTPLAGDLAPFTVVVGYDATPHSDAVMAGAGVVTVWSYTIAASAAYSTPGASNYVERVVNAKM